MLKIRHRLVILAIAAGLGGCATTDGPPESTTIVVDAAPARSPADIQKIAELERQLLREQRQYQAERRRLELSQKQNEELQKKLDDLQKKLDALLAIDRDLRSRSQNR